MGTSAPDARGSTASSFDYREAFCRNLGLVTPAEQARLRETRIAIAGLGGVGGLHLLALARLGVGKFSLADGDRFELANMNRQVGATTHTLGEAKVDTMAAMARAINPTLDLRVFPADVDPTNVDAFLEGAIAAVDGIDFFNMRARRLLFRKAYEHRIHAITAAPVGCGSALLTFAPTGMTFDEYFDLDDDMSEAEQLLQFGLGLTPRLLQRSYFAPGTVDLAARRAPSLGPACLLAASLVATEVLNLVLQRRPVRAAPHFSQFDPLTGRYATGRLRWGNRHPLQRVKRWWVLRTNPALQHAMRTACR